MNRKKTKKTPKVYIPTYKIIILCGSIIAVCMMLLLITNLVSIKKADKEEKVTVAQRYTDEKSEKSKKSPSIDEIKGSNATGTTAKPLEEPKTQSDNKKQSESKKQSEAKKQTETAKTNDKTAASSQKTEQQKSQLTAQNTTKTEKKSTSQNTAQTTTQNTAQTTAPAQNVATVSTKTSVVPAPETKITTQSFDFPAAVNHAQLVFVFDDGGQNLTHLEKFLNLPFPITFAVLPQITHSREAADRIHKSGNEVMLHQPMQAVNKNVNPGPGAITPQMNEDQIISMLFQNINELGPIAGMNNHEGSAITADAEKMSTILKFASESGIFFLDSRTNVDTQVPYVASELGYSYYERNIFLDNTKNRSDILNEINKGLALANKNGVVIMIGHIWSADVLPGILKEIYPELVQKGYTFSTVSKSKAKKGQN